MIRTRVLAAGTAIVLVSLSPVTNAADGEFFQFDAFGTLGLVHSSEDQADFTRSSLVPKGAGASQRVSPRVDSVLGGQITANFTSSLSGVVQVVSEYRHDDSYDPRVEWANLRYEITPDLAVVAGRIASPIFKLTDTRRISFALPWVRPPLEVYDLYPVTSNDGIYLDWRTRFGDTTHLLEIAWGRSDSRFSHAGLSGTAEGRNQVIVRSTFERGALAVNLGFSPADLTIPEMLPLFDAFRQFGPQGEAIADQYEPDSREARYYGVGVTWDPGPWFAMAEWAQLDFDGVLTSKTGWYVSAGLRRGAFTPYATWAKTGPKRARSAGLDLASLPPESVAEAAALNAQLDYILNSAPDQDTFTIGVRWDIAAALALKLQHSHIDLAPGSVGTLANFQPGFVPGGKVNVLSLAVSFVL